MQRKDNTTGTAYLITWPAKGKGPGHTSLYVTGPNHKFFYLSIYPSGGLAGLFHKLFGNFTPVKAFNSKGPEWDAVTVEKNPPASILEITNISYDAMHKTYNDQLDRIKEGKTLFSLGYYNPNPFNWLIRSLSIYGETNRAYQNNPQFSSLYKRSERALIMPNVSANSEDIISFKNCTGSVIPVLTAGGLTLGNTYHSSYSRFFAGNPERHIGMPPRLHLNLAKHPDAREMLSCDDTINDLPLSLQKAIELGKQEQIKRTPISSDEDCLSREIAHLRKRD